MDEPAYFAAHRRSAPWLTRSAWPFSWVGGSNRTPTIGVYRLNFTSSTSECLRLVVSADERYRLFLDGRHLGSGPELGTRWRWQADIIEADLSVGEHQLLAVVWSVGAADGDFATDGIAHGFALGVDSEANPRLATGQAPWEWHELPGYQFRKSPLAHWTVPDLFRDAAEIDWDVEAGSGSGWTPAREVSLVHHVGDVEIFPARLVEASRLSRPLYRLWPDIRVRHVEEILSDTDPTLIPLGADDPVLNECVTALLAEGRPLEIPAHKTVRALLDCGTYLTAWPEFRAGGAGAEVAVDWMEALSRQPVTGALLDKENCAEVAGRYARGLGDRVRCDGILRTWRPLYWRSGRFVILTIRAGDEAATFSDFRLFEDRYPLEQEAQLEIGHAGIQAILPLCLRTLQVNAHDQFSDTPYYERMQYLGDCRIDCLNNYVISRDRHLVEKALRMADSQRLPNGLTVSRTPTRNLQVIPPFSLFYVGMVRDHLWWHGSHELVRSLMPGVRGVLDCFLRHLRPDATLGFMEGWNFCDWSAPFANGEPTGNREGACPANLQLLMALGWVEELESAFGEVELAARWRRLRAELAHGITIAFWSEANGAWADDRGHTSFSQHSQALAALCPDLPPELRRRSLDRLGSDATLAPASLYFIHYLIEAWALAGEGERIVSALGFWVALPAQGFVTLPEAPEPSRSDCHAWCAHPLFHTAATLAGIRPAAPGFARVSIAPCLGSIPSVSVRIPHPSGGWIRVDLQAATGRLQGQVELPAGIDGIFVWAGKEMALRPGLTNINLHTTGHS